MKRKIQQRESRANPIELPGGAVLKPPVSAEDLRADTENDPQGADEFVALIRTLRKEGSRPVSF